MAAARCTVSMSRDRNAAIFHRFIAFLDYIGRHVGVLWTRDAVSLTCNVATLEAHTRRSGLDSSIVIGTIANSNQIYHPLPTQS